MTAEQKERVAVFLDRAADFLRHGYKTPRGQYDFKDREDVSAPGAEAGDCLEKVAEAIAACAGCGLAGTRTKTVPGEGVRRPLVVVVGEGPGAEEDAWGKPFVGNAGQLLTKMLGAIRLSRERNCFILNVVKCRPPRNREPAPEEIAACGPFLSRQIALLEPRAILCVGRTPARTLLKSAEPIGSLRGRFFEYAGIPLIATYHPSALLRDQSLKRPTWEDLKKLRDRLAALDEGYAREARESDAP
ncbi:MAG: uracil-DNA glycosylase [Spirochaetaceae bacterium]|jgi:DNA polymerase|nr:uracil-DNA glycosylase [Spirochaetaceae bacterium]